MITKGPLGPLFTRGKYDNIWKSGSQAVFSHLWMELKKRNFLKIDRLFEKGVMEHETGKYDRDHGHEFNQNIE